MWSIGCFRAWAASRSGLCLSTFGYFFYSVDFNRDYSVQPYWKSLFTHMMANILVCLSLMLRGSSSVVSKAVASNRFPSFKLNKACGKIREHYSYSYSIMCVHGSQCQSCSHQNISYWFWNDAMWDLWFITSILPTDYHAIWLYRWPLSVTSSCYQHYCSYSLHYSDPYSVCYQTNLIHLPLLHFFCSLPRANVAA